MIIERRGSAKNRANFASSANSLALLQAFTGALHRPSNASSTILAAMRASASIRRFHLRCSPSNETARAGAELRQRNARLYGGNVACTSAILRSLNRRVVAAAAGDAQGARRRVYKAGTPTVVEPAA